MDAKTDIAEVLETPLASPAAKIDVKTTEIPASKLNRNGDESVDDLYTR